MSRDELIELLDQRLPGGPLCVLRHARPRRSDRFLLGLMMALADVVALRILEHLAQQVVVALFVGSPIRHEQWMTQERRSVTGVFLVIVQPSEPQHCDPSSPHREAMSLRA